MSKKQVENRCNSFEYRGKVYCVVDHGELCYLFRRGHVIWHESLLYKEKPTGHPTTLACCIQLVLNSSLCCQFIHLRRIKPSLDRIAGMLKCIQPQQCPIFNKDNDDMHCNVPVDISKPDVTLLVCVQDR